MSNRYTDVETITENDRLRLLGLLTLGHRHERLLREIEAAACEITGEDLNSGGHTGDEIFSPRGDGPNVDDLLKRLGIRVEKRTGEDHG